MINAVMGGLIGVAAFSAIGVAALMAAPSLSHANPSTKELSKADATAHRFTFVGIDGSPLPLEQFKGRPVLVVNTASECGFTPQYESLQTLWERYKDQGLVVLGIPSNDFGGQEPGTAAEIKHFCESVFSVSFPLADKTVVTGDDAHPFYRWAADVRSDLPQPRWNFHKYLIGPDGQLVDAFRTHTDPLGNVVTTRIDQLLTQADG